MSKTFMQLDSIIDIMGGEKTLGTRLASPIDFMIYSQKGIPVAVVRSIQKRTGFTIREMGKVLHISESTLQRRLRKTSGHRNIKGEKKIKSDKSSAYLNSDEAEKAYYLSQVFAKGEEVFGNTEKFRNWLLEENIVLGNQKPMDLLSSSIGTEQVLELLFGIEHGHFF